MRASKIIEAVLIGGVVVRVVQVGRADKAERVWQLEIQAPNNRKFIT